MRVPGHQDAAAAQDSAGLRRVLGRRDLAGLMVNSTIGAGILGLPGKLYALTGSWCLLIAVAASLLIGLAAASFAQAGSRFSRTGGAYLYVQAAFGPLAGFMMGWLSLLTALLSYATIANLVLSYAAPILPGIDQGAARLAALAAMNLVFGAILYRGIALSAAMHNMFTAAKFLLLGGFVLLAAPAILTHGIPATPWPGLANAGSAMVLMIFAVMGLEAAIISNGEMRDPARDIAPAFAAGLATVSLLYGLVLLGCMAALPDLGHSARPVYDAACALAGPVAGNLVIAGGAVSMSGVLFVILFSGPRVAYAMARAGQLPAPLARLHPRFATPGLAIIVHGSAAFLLAANASFLTALHAAALTRLLSYAATGISAALLARRGFSETPRPLELPHGQAICLISAVLCLGLVAQSSAADARALLFCLLPGLLLALAMRVPARAAVAQPYPPHAGGSSST